MIKVIEACSTCTKVAKSRDVKGNEIIGCKIKENRYSRIYYRGKIIGCSGYVPILDKIQHPDEIEAHILKMENERDRALRNKSEPGLDFTSGAITVLNWVLKRK